MADALVIVANSSDKTLGLAVFSGQDGSLSPFELTAFPGVEGANGPSPMVISPDRRLLHVAFRGTPPAVLSFRIDYAKRRLDYLGKAPLADSMAYLALDRTGRCLFGASYGSGKFSVNALDEEGLPGSIVDVFDAGPRAHCVQPSVDNKMVYVTSVGREAVLRCAFDADSCRLRPLDPPAAQVAPGTGPRHLVFDGSGRYAYVVNQEGGSVDAYTVNDDGTFAHLQRVDIIGPSIADSPLASDIHLTPNGRFLFASERTSNTLAGYAVDPTKGCLSEVVKVDVPPTPRGFAIDPTGRFLLVLGETCATLTTFSIEPNFGELHALRTCQTGNGPNWIEILPLNQ